MENLFFLKKNHWPPQKIHYAVLQWPTRFIIRILLFGSFLVNRGTFLNFCINQEEDTFCQQCLKLTVEEAQESWITSRLHLLETLLTTSKFCSISSLIQTGGNLCSFHIAILFYHLQAILIHLSVPAAFCFNHFNASFSAKSKTETITSCAWCHRAH